MLDVTLEKRRLPEFLKALAEGRRLIAPVADRRGTAFAEVGDVSQVRLAAGAAAFSAKAVVFPQTEILCTFAGAEAREATADGQEVILFGLRPCDARALTLLDKVFAWDGVRDPYYFRRREKTILIAVACNEPGPACFCTSVGGAPADAAGADILASDLGAKLLLAACTSRGADLLKGLGRLTGKAGEKDRQAGRAAAAKAAAAMERVRQRVLHKFLYCRQNFGAAFCVGCGRCVVNCPGGLDLRQVLSALAAPREAAAPASRRG
jgi:ferredoxin